MTNEIYRARILDHFQHPRHRGSLETMQSIGRAAIPMCGDEIEVGVREVGDAGLTVRFRGRACAVCIASASMMAELVDSLDRARVRELTDEFLGWMLGRADGRNARRRSAGAHRDLRSGARGGQPCALRRVAVGCARRRAGAGSGATSGERRGRRDRARSLRPERARIEAFE